MKEKPVLGDPLPASHANSEFLSLLKMRRSTTAAMMAEPGPSAEQLETILDIASRVPDHRRVVPYRFIVFEAAARREAGDILSTVYGKQHSEAESAALELEAGRFLRAPVVVAVVAKTDASHKTPEWEQVLCCGAVCHNMLLAASASGFAAQWLTEWYAYDREVLAAFGLSEEERIAGFIFIGTAKEDPLERPRVEAADITTHWQGD